jgi:hypothetical protein
LAHFNIFTAYLGCPTVPYSTVTTVNTISASNKLNISGHFKQSLSPLAYAVTSQPAPSRVTLQALSRQIKEKVVLDLVRARGTDVTVTLNNDIHEHVE